MVQLVCPVFLTVTQLIATEVADVFLKSSASAAVSLPKSKSREELAAALSAMKGEDAELLRLEVDTMEEEWLVALQDELTKPYFLNVRVTNC